MDESALEWWWSGYHTRCVEEFEERRQAEERRRLCDANDANDANDNVVSLPRRAPEVGNW